MSSMKPLTANEIRSLRSRAELDELGTLAGLELSRVAFLRALSGLPVRGGTRACVRQFLAAPVAASTTESPPDGPRHAA